MTLPTVLSALPLACGNATLTLDTSRLAVADLGPIGLGIAAFIVYRTRRHPWRPGDRSLVLLLGALAGCFAGALFGFHFKPSPYGLTTIPLLGSLVGWLHVRGRMFPALIRWEKGEDAEAAEEAWRRAMHRRELAEALARAEAEADAEDAALNAS